MLFMRTILSLSLATLALTIPVAQPQAVGDLGGVGLIGRDNPVFQGVASLVNDYLGLSVSSGFLDQQTYNSFLDEVDVLVGNGLSAIGENGGSGLDVDSINNILQEIEINADTDFSEAVVAGNVTQDVVNNMLIDLDNFIGFALQEGDSESDSA